MLTIDIKGKYLVLSSGSGIPAQFQNPVCFTDKIVGDRAVNITLPINEINRAILGNPEMFEKYYVGASRKFPGARLSFNDAEIIAGTLVVIDTTDNYNCWIQPDVGVMSEATQNKNITDFDWPAEQNFVNKSNYDDETDNYNPFTIINRGFWDGMGAEYDVRHDYIDAYGKLQYREEKMAKLQKLHFENFAFKVNAKNPDGTTITEGEGCVVSPFLYMRYVISELLRMNGFYININEMYPEDLPATAREKNLMVYHNFSILKAIWDTQEVYTQEWDPDRQEMVDIANEFITNIIWAPGTFNYSDLLPKINLKDFFLGIQNALNYVFRYRNDYKVDIIDRNAIPESAAIDINDYRIGSWQMGEKISRRIKFEPEFDKDDSPFGNNYEDLTARLADFKEPVQTYDDLLALPVKEIGELRLATKPNLIFEYKWKVASGENAAYLEDQLDTIGWEPVSIGWQPYIVNPDNETEEIIKVPLTGLLENKVGLNYEAAVQKGNLAQMRSTYADFSFRALIDNWVNFPDRMAWNGETGIYKTRWENWAKMWADRQEVTAEFNFPLHMIIYVAENITSKFRTDEGEFIIEKMECDFRLNSIGKTRITGYKI